MSTYESIPQASLLLNSLRSVGYAEDAAIADIVDNSISAKATEIKINFNWEKQEIVIQDNGIGMSKNELYENMKIGSSDPNASRDDLDLGRFGMGLKTASFSLGRQLIVVTNKNGLMSNASWDLDSVDKLGWKLIIDDEGIYEEYLDKEQLSSTAVIIKKLDVFKERNKSSNLKKYFFSVIRDVTEHLRVVFHRFIKEDGLRIYVNDNLLEAWDPFVLDNSATQELPSEELWDSEYNTCATIQPYVLPHKTKFISESAYEEAAGYRGWNLNQGIYLYRNRRLIISGTWFNLVKKEPAFNLARIKIDINSESDEYWKIDIKKSRASLPSAYRDRLFATVFDCTSRSTKVFNSRGAYSKSPLVPKLDFVWEQTKTKNGYLFKINKKHPILDSIRSELDDMGREKLKSFISLIENFAPYMKNCMVNTCSSNEINVDESVRQKDIAELTKIIKVFFAQGFSVEEIIETINDMPLYNYINDQVNSILESIRDK
ncbi:ATP-binding protein [Succinivibrio faecicola]|uniref:ATP-binding protein n=1 Tax=Succinivibrio faecicola TaxID=2820300 RepID=A0ABS7DGT3_9GAMM|nr:ATP-binding protein [Succinivibrio faecicola]MBW7570505.1 ATP-binding protein [Succinivibrio faecicola]